MHPLLRGGLIGLGSALLASCGGQPADPQLEQAADALAAMTQSSHLSRSCFYLVYPSGRAPEFIQYLFSDLGAAEWPVALDPMEAEQMQAAGQTVLPPEVSISPQQRRNPQQKELVLTADAEGQVVATGYLPGETEPNLTENWQLATATPDEFARNLCQSNLEMGIDGGAGGGSLQPPPAPTE